VLRVPTLKLAWRVKKCRMFAGGWGVRYAFYISAIERVKRKGVR
jgi:hypothetical protein